MRRLQRPPEPAFRPTAHHLERFLEGERLSNGVAQLEEISGGEAVHAPVGSETRQVRERQAACADMEAAEFGAAMQSRKHLAGVEQTVRVECAFNTLLMRQVA